MQLRVSVEDVKLLQFPKDAQVPAIGNDRVLPLVAPWCHGIGNPHATDLGLGLSMALMSSAIVHTFQALVKEPLVLINLSSLGHGSLTVVPGSGCPGLGL